MYLLKVAFVSLVLLSGCSSSEDAHTSASAERVVLAHGLGRSDTAMWLLKHRIEDAGYDVCAIDYATIGQSLKQVKFDSQMAIDDCLANADTVHFVGHSLGGLVIRDYLAKNDFFYRQHQLGEVVLIGTPNSGSEVADAMEGHFMMTIGGGVSEALMTGKASFGQQIPTPEYQPGVIAGARDTHMTRKHFSGPNDGLVSVESARVSNMKDLIVLPVGHSAMRYDADTAAQVIHFLQQGEFQH